MTTNPQSLFCEFCEVLSFMGVYLSSEIIGLPSVLPSSPSLQSSQIDRTKIDGDCTLYHNTLQIGTKQAMYIFGKLIPAEKIFVYGRFGVTRTFLCVLMSIFRDFVRYELWVKVQCIRDYPNLDYPNLDHPNTKLGSFFFLSQTDVRLTTVS